GSSAARRPTMSNSTTLSTGSRRTRRSRRSGTPKASTTSWRQHAVRDAGKRRGRHVLHRLRAASLGDRADAAADVRRRPAGTARSPTRLLDTADGLDVLRAVGRIAGRTRPGRLRAGRVRHPEAPRPREDARAPRRRHARARRHDSPRARFRRRASIIDIASLDSPRLTEEASMATITTKDGTHLYYNDWGTGQPVVFSHGWPLCADAFEDQMYFLASRGYRCIAHDRRGPGRSS